NAARRQGPRESYVSHLEARHIRIARLERFIAAAQESAFAQLKAKRRVARDGDIWGQRALEADFVGRHGADGGVISKQRAEAPGEDPVGRGLVVVAGV